MEKPEATLNTVKAWAGMAEEECRKQGRKDAAALWRDAIAWLNYLEAENDRLKAETNDNV